MDNDITRGIKIYLDTTRYAEGIQQLVSSTQKYTSELKQLQDAGLGNTATAQKLEAQIKRNTDTESKYRAALEQQKSVLENLGSATGNQLNSLKKFLMAQEKDAVPGTAKHTATLEQLKRVNDQLAISQQRVRGETEKQTTSFLSMSKMKASIVGFFAGIGASISGVAYNFINNTSEFINKSISMSSAADGIKHAFERLNRPDILSNLRKETKGTVNDVNLMKAAVKADFFKVPLDKLGTYLRFAQQRAQDTGQSVDELSEKLISGLGRKSTKVLAQLGLSTAEVNAKTKETGDFMTAVSQIIENELAKSTDDYTAASTKAAQRTAALENKMLLLGDALRPVKGQYNAMKQSVKIFFADSAIWIAQHKELLITVTTAVVSYYSAVKIAAFWQAKYKEESLASIIVEKSKAAWTAISKGATLLYAAATLALEGNTIRATAAMRLFNMTTKLNPVGLLVGLLTAGAAAFLLFKNNVSITKTAISDLNTKLDIERTSLNNIFEEMKRTNPGTSQRIALVKQLNDKYPGLISNYNLEKSSLKEITLAQNEANKALVNRVATEMKAQQMTDVITNNINKQRGFIDIILNDMKKNMGENVFNKVESSIRSFLSDSSKTVGDFKKKYKGLFSFTGTSDRDSWEAAFGFLREHQKGLKGEMNAVTAAYKPYIDSLNSAAKSTHVLTDEEKKQQMEQSSILVKLQKQKQHVQDTWKEDSKENIVLKNKELERIDKEISKYQELGKSKKQSKNGTYTSEVDKALSPIENTHQKELLSLSATKEKELKTEAEYNKKVLLEDKRYYAEKIAALVNLENTVSKAKTKTRDDINKKETEARSKLIETQRKYDENEISLLKEKKDKQLGIDDSEYKIAKTKLELKYSEGKMEKEDYEVTLLSLSSSYAQKKLNIEKGYLSDVNNLNLTNNKIKEDELKKANENVLSAELNFAESKKELYRKAEDAINNFNGKDKDNLWDVKENVANEIKALDDVYKIQRDKFKDNKEELLQLEEAYQDTKKGILKKELSTEKDKLNKQLDNYKSYGSSIGEALGNVLTGQENAISAFGDTMIDILFDVLTDIVNEKIAEAAAVAIAEQAKATAVAAALPDSVITFGASAAPRIAIIGGLIMAGLATAKAALKGLISKGKSSSSSDSSSTTTPVSTTRIVNQGYSEGGYTGEGGRYEIAGAVHRGEYVVPAPEMNNPRVIDSVKVIESVRRQRTGVNPLPGYAEGGYVREQNNISPSQYDEFFQAIKEFRSAVGDLNKPKKNYVLLSDINEQQDLKIKAEKPFTRGDKKNGTNN